MWQLNTEFSNTPFWETRGAIRKLTLEFPLGFKSLFKDKLILCHLFLIPQNVIPILSNEQAGHLCSCWPTTTSPTDSALKMDFLPEVT